MWLEAIVTEDDIAQMAAQLAPLEIRLGTDGLLRLARPARVAFRPDRGVELACDAELHWPVLGVCVPVSMEALTVLVRPSVEQRPDGYALVFRLAIERTGVSHLAFVDERVTSLVNGELEKHHVELAWNFTRTLTHTFSLPAGLLTAEALTLSVRSGKTKVTGDALGLAVLMGTSVRRRGDGPRDPT